MCVSGMIVELDEFTDFADKGMIYIIRKGVFKYDGANFWEDAVNWVIGYANFSQFITKNA